MIVPIENAPGIVSGKSFDEFLTRLFAVRAQSVNTGRRHVKIETSVVLRETHLPDAISESGQAALCIVSPVLRCHDNARQKAEQPAQVGASVEPAPFHQGAGSIGLRHEESGGIVRMLLGEIDAERRPPRQRRIEKMDRKVAAETAVRKPAPFRPVITSVLPAVVDGVQWYTTKQDRKAQTHAHRDNNWKVFRLRQRNEAGATILDFLLGVRRRGGSSARLHPRDHAFRK